MVIAGSLIAWVVVSCLVSSLVGAWMKQGLGDAGADAT